MARKKLKYELLLKSLEKPDNLNYWEFDWGYYGDDDYDNYYDDNDVYYEYLDNNDLDILYVSKYRLENRKLPYRIVDMNSIYSKEKRREIKINKILGLSKDIEPLTLYDFYLKNKNLKWK